MARIKLGDSAAALSIWKGAIERIKSPDLKAECRIAAADILITDLAKPAEAKPLLEAASAQLGKARSGPLDSALQRVWGDYYAATGDGKAARKAYLAAEASPRAKPATSSKAPPGKARAAVRPKCSSRRSNSIAPPRSFSIGNENIRPKRSKDISTCFYASIFSTAKCTTPAVAQAERLQAVNADSAYVDQILLLAADCELRRGKKDRAWPR